MVAALLLDFDGTLYDTETAGLRSWQEIYAQHGVELPLAAWVGEVMGRAPGTSSFEPLTHLQQLTGVRLDLEGLAAGRERRRRELLPDRLMPGADALLAAARSRGVATAIVTSNHRDNVLAHLARAGCEHPWDAVVCADGEPLRGKPRPTLYLEALQLLGLAAGEAVAFEDSPNGVAAAKAAGLRCLVVPNDVTRGAAGLDAGDAMLASLADFALQDE